MPYNGSGLFTRVHDWTDDADANIDIEADRMDEEDDGFATGLSNAICKDGQTTITANLPMAGFRHTGVGNASARAHYGVVGQIQDNTYTWVDGGGTADAITATYTPNVTALVDGMELKVRATAANATTTPTFSPNGLTARTITKSGNTALAAGDIAADGHELILRYRLSDTKWELLNPAVVASATAPFADTTAIIKGSADATKLLRIEVDGFTSGTTRVMTPPDQDFTVVGVATTQTLTNKALSDSTTTIVDEGDATKKLAFQCSGITAGNTRTLTVPDASGTIALTATAGTARLLGSTTYTTNTTLSTAIPGDDTIPQNTEGTQIMTVTATPTSASKTIVVMWGVYFSGSGGGTQYIAAPLFKDSGANALATPFGGIPGGGLMANITGVYTESAASTSSRDYKVRLGADTGDVYPNGTAGSTRKYGGTTACYLLVYEV